MATRNEASSSISEPLIAAEKLSPSRVVWAGRILSGLIILFLLSDAIPKALGVGFAVDATVELGYPDAMVVPIGLALLACTILYAIPRTAILGAILLTGFLGGAVATNVRLEELWFLFPFAMGVLVWVGLYLRDRRLRNAIST